jgi:transcriptional regulator with GAF, ATPase, and Fis domain
MTSISGLVLELAPAVRQSRLADLATRLAIHFFTEQSVTRFCDRVLQEVIKETRAQSGAFILFGRDPAEANIVAARDFKLGRVPKEDVRVSRTILAQIREGETSVLVEDARADKRFMGEESVEGLALRSVLAIPLRVEDYLAGAIHLENARAAGAFDEEDRQLLLALGRVVTVYLNSAFRLDEEIAARQRIYAEIKGKTHFGIVGSSPRLAEVMELIAQAGPSIATVLIEGESGTGKELIARALHHSSKRADRLLVTVNCAAIPETLLESELFGHERGAFTGAFGRQIGRLEQADKSTVFLDEIAEMSLPLQAKLLRFLQDREIERLGSTRTIKLDVRLIAATSRDIREMVKQGEFREDLFYRLYVIPIKVPALRDRPEDIPLLIDHFLRVFSLQSGRPDPEVAVEVYEAFQEYSWPGNVRELENLVQRLVVLCGSGRIGMDDLPPHIVEGRKTTLDIGKNPFGGYFTHPPTTWTELKRSRRQMHRIATSYAQKLEDRFLDDLLERTGGNISRAARQSGINRTIIHRKLRARSH